MDNVAISKNLIYTLTSFALERTNTINIIMSIPGK
jgi:hypothetical protein